jgi:chemotaxis protein methyltransferase CheR
MREELLALVAQRSGMVFAPNRRVEAEAGIARAMKRAGADDVDAYLAMVRGDGIGLDGLVDELTVGETHFMRDPDQLELVRREVFPALKGRPARVWSAGCATGEEAYSLAILLEQEGMGDGAVVLGTDLSAVSLEKARTASYSDYSMRDVGLGFLESYFHHFRGRRLLVERIRSKVRFEHLNLVGAEDYASAGAVAMDLILCRNVLIYFGREKVGRGRSAAHRGCRSDPRRIRPLRSGDHARGPRLPAPPPRTDGGGAAKARPGGSVTGVVSGP